MVCLICENKVNVKDKNITKIKDQVVHNDCSPKNIKPKKNKDPVILIDPKANAFVANQNIRGWKDIK